MLSFQTKDKCPSSSKSATHLTKSKYPSTTRITNEEVLQLPEMLPTNSILNSPWQRQPCSGYCDLCLPDDSTSSAWVRYNEQRIDQLQQRIDLMLQIDDSENLQFFLSNFTPITDTVTQRIDDILVRKPKHHFHLTHYHDRLRMSNYCFLER